METITKEAIKARAAKLWAISDALEALNRRGYYLRDSQSWDYIKHEYIANSYDYTLEYTSEEGDHMLHYHTTEDRASAVTGHSRRGGALVETVDHTLADVLKAFAADRMLFTIHNATVRSYDGKLRVNVDTCTQPMDFDKMTDGYYTETTYTLNRKGQVFQSKPKSYSRSVLVALNID